MSLPVVSYTSDGKPVYAEGAANPAKLKRCVVRNLGRIEQIFACAERLMERHDDVDDSVQAATKKA